MQHAIQEGRLKFGDKNRSQMKIDSDPLQVADAHYMEPEEVKLVKVIDDFDMIEVTEDFVNEPVMAKVSERLDQESFYDFIQKLWEIPPTRALMSSMLESLKIPI